MTPFFVYRAKCSRWVTNPLTTSFLRRFCFSIEDEWWAVSYIQDVENYKRQNSICHQRIWHEAFPSMAPTSLDPSFTTGRGHINEHSLCRMALPALNTASYQSKLSYRMVSSDRAKTFSLTFPDNLFQCSRCEKMGGVPCGIRDHRITAHNFL